MPRVAIDGNARIVDDLVIKRVGGKNACEFSMRVIEGRWEDETKQNWNDRGFWATATVWNSLAEKVVDLFKKNDTVYFTGSVHLDRWVNDNQEEKERFKIQIENIFPNTFDLVSISYRPPKSSSAESSSTSTTSESKEPVGA